MRGEREGENGEGGRERREREREKGERGRVREGREVGRER